MLRLEGLSCGYGNMIAVSDLDLRVENMDILALIGANGAGKTSTLMAIAGHVSINSGRIFVADEDITELSPEERVEMGIAVVPEGRRIFKNLTVDENLVMGGYCRPKSAYGTNRDKVYDHFPVLAERANQLAGTMSGGEQQMLAISRALMSEPRLLLVDELSLGLMPKAVDLCYNVLEKLRANGMTILLVEQGTERAMAVSDYVCVLETGQKVLLEISKQAMQNPLLIESYLGINADSKKEGQPVG